MPPSLGTREVLLSSNSIEAKIRQPQLRNAASIIPLPQLHDIKNINISDIRILYWTAVAEPDMNGAIREGCVAKPQRSNGHIQKQRQVTKFTLAVNAGRGNYDES